MSKNGNTSPLRSDQSDALSVAPEVAADIEQDNGVAQDRHQGRLSTRSSRSSDTGIGDDFGASLLTRACSAVSAISLSNGNGADAVATREPPWEGRSSRRKSPNRATTNPNPIIASPVRIHAKSVLSAAKYTRGSFSGKSGTFPPVFQREFIPLRSPL
jgi:hypothetical protein